ncbi:AraC family transcriptional regulator [Paraburkholderia sp. JHI869]|uniref:AraC family transcriptional regulator n=1 Tax=Paraburkholderia sp. JHI869 TaxID=3112959 RepID=UPI00316CB495
MLALHEHVSSTYGKRAPGKPPPRGALAPWQLRRAKDYMLEHMHGEIGLDNVAAQCELSVNHFVRAFRESTGTTPHRWLVSERLKGAMHLMRDARLSLAQVAAACGFADQSHLTRAFSARFGMPTGQWRRICRETGAAAASALAVE